MTDNPAVRSFVAALALIVALGGLALSLARPLYAQAEGVVLALGQALHEIGGGRPAIGAAWFDTAPGGASVDRATLAAAIERLQQAHPRVIVVAQPLEGAGGSADLTRVREFLDSAEAAADPALRARLQAWAAELDHDARLERAIRAAGNVVLIARAADGGVVRPLERFAGAARAVGVEPAAEPAADGVLRVDSLRASDDGAPSLPAAAWLVAVGGSGRDVAWRGGALSYGDRTLPATGSSRWVPWLGGPTRATATAADLAAAAAAPADLAGKIVVLGPGTVSVRTAVGTLAQPDAIAQRAASLHGGYVLRPAWAWLVGALILLLAPALSAALANRRPSSRFAIGVLVFVVALVIELVVLLAAHLWVPLAVPALGFPLAALATTFLGSPRDFAAETGPVRPVRIPPAVRPAPGPRPRPALPADAAPARTPAAAPRPGTSATDTSGAHPSTIREISEQLRARQEERSRTDVADLLLGRSKRAPKPRLGRYELERELGHGAMGTVYLGRDPNINRVVAVKAIPLTQEFEGAALTEARTRFFREAEMAGRLQHPSIVTVYDAGEDNGIAFIAMEYVKGRLLSEHATSDVLLPAPQVLEIVARIADALDYAHRQDIVHRDIKPANVIFDPATLDAKITDFGIARLTNSSATRTGIVLGTPSFMAPEQLEGRNVTGRSDLFALGVTLFQLLAGELPFRADSMTGLMDKIANHPHPPLRTIRPDLPPCVGLIVDRALQKDPAHRFATAAEMARALRACARSVAA